MRCCKPLTEHCCHRRGIKCGWYPQGYGYCKEQEDSHRAAEDAMLALQNMQEKEEEKDASRTTED